MPTKKLLVGLWVVIGAPVLVGQYPATFQITKDGTSIVIEDYASVPSSSLMRDQPYPAPVDPRGQLARVNGLVSEPADAPQSTARFFVIDQNGIVYTLDKATKAFASYIDIGRVFGKFTNTGSLGMGVASIAFDPAYARNGRFYTVHNERPVMPAAAAPVNASLPGLNLAGYAMTPAMNPPVGNVSHESLLVEWTDTNIRNGTFEGTARESKTGSQVQPPVAHPSPDTLIVEGLDKPVTPIYPVAVFSHREGTAIGSGFVYRGKLMPQLTGKYVFSEIVTGRIFYTDLAEMRAAQGSPGKTAAIHELQGGGRADVRFAVGGDGEIYILSKSDGMIRKMTAATRSSRTSS